MGSTGRYGNEGVGKGEKEQCEIGRQQCDSRPVENPQEQHPQGKPALGREGERRQHQDQQHDQVERPPARREQQAHRMDAT
jgi:hypothetical protein